MLQRRDEKCACISFKVLVSNVCLWICGHVCMRVCMCSYGGSHYKSCDGNVDIDGMGYS